MNNGADSDFVVRYKETLDHFLKDSGERVREEAYAIGRSALERGLGLMDLLALHKKVMDTLPRSVWPAGMDFLSEAAAPLEMQVRGYKELNESLQQLNKNLETRVEERTHSLKLAEERFFQAQKLEGIGRLAGGVAHDFNNLLTVINGYAEMALEESRRGEGVQERLQDIATAGKRAAALTRQLLAFSRKHVVKPGPVDLNAVVADMQKMLRRLIREDVQLEFVPGKGLERIMADAGQIEQVVMNLSVNASDAMPLGGRLIMETSSVSLDAESLKAAPDCLPGPYVLLSISDTGVGMDDATRARLFEPFFTTKDPGKGTGLGLATVYGIVRNSRGLIWIYSEPGKGTSVKVYFPASTGTEAPQAPVEAAPAVLPRGSERIMVVEDDEQVRRFTLGVLERAGYPTIEASRPDEALVAVEEGKEFSMLVTDLMMPGMSGWELATRMKKLRPGLDVLYLSGYAGGAVSARGMLEPGIDFLEKPYAPADLARKVREILDRRAGVP
jgi:two-component system cell cycle sensor histidine kinase/response regulator CckA